ncbi:insulin-2-like [Leptopilina heterotoma]|uniref:insulin-2-like n=1 Tax=Leptopilina heterotoma TaxID=63436 RepID=UPI001CA9F482|nr:insulin-2-like [Leptopilina heterotoma]
MKLPRGSIWILILFVVICQQRTSAKPLFIDEKIQLCSNALSNALSLICGDTGYNSFYYPIGRAIRKGEIDANSLDRGSNPRRQGIVDECCRQSCYLSQMREYCRDD